LRQVNKLIEGSLVSISTIRREKPGSF